MSFKRSGHSIETVISLGDLLGQRVGKVRVEYKTCRPSPGFLGVNFVYIPTWRILEFVLNLSRERNSKLELMR